MKLTSQKKSLVSEEVLREVLSHYLTGVTIVTITKPDGTPYGLTVNSSLKNGNKYFIIVMGMNK